MTPPVMVPWGTEETVGSTKRIGTELGIFPNAKKCWLIVKQEKEEAARDLFGQTSIDIPTQGPKHLGAVLGSRSYPEEYVNEKAQMIGLAR